MKVINDVHKQFAEYFPSKTLQPYLYLLSKKLSEGHICIDVDQVDEEELSLQGYKEIIGKKKLQEESMVSSDATIKPLVLCNNNLYLQRYYNYETIILNRVKLFIESEKSVNKEKLKGLQSHAKYIKTLFKNTGHGPGKNRENINWPLVAAISAIKNKFTIITGGPGTGKTTTVAKILSILFTINPVLKVALAAPTGKAAARMAESLKNASPGADVFLQSKLESLEPSTIHRLLGTKKNRPYFKHDSEHHLNYDVVIVDESSMIDIALFAKLKGAIGPETSLILLGDKDQLASVEAGSLFSDLCQAQDKLNMFSKSGADLINSFIDEPGQKISSNFISTSSHPLFEHIIELQRSHRFSDNKGIGKFSKAIIHNNINVIRDFFYKKDEEVEIDTAYSETIFESFIAGYNAFILEKDIATALKKLNRLRVLCAVRNGEHGLYAINRKIEKYLLQKKLIRLTGEFYEHRPVMITSNNYELQLFNGDIGIIRPDESGVLKAWFESPEGELRTVLPGYISNAETVYAMTIHKSQGSEFDEVFVILPKGENIPLLTRELLYTAITRAKQKVIVQGSEEVIMQTAKAFVKRGSGIIERFLSE